MKLDAVEQKAGMQWFIGAGLFGVALSIFLYRADQKLTLSDSDQINCRHLQELRVAQTSLQSRVTDIRQTRTPIVNESKGTEAGSASHDPVDPCAPTRGIVGRD